MFPTWPKISSKTFAAEGSSIKGFQITRKGLLEKETCELGLNNYRCDEIKDGTVIIKDNKNKTQEPDKDDEEEYDDSDF